MPTIHTGLNLKGKGRFKVAGPYHGESFSLWYVVDTKDHNEPQCSFRSAEAARYKADAMNYMVRSHAAKKAAKSRRGR